MKSPDPLEELRRKELQTGGVGTGGLFGWKEQKDTEVDLASDCTWSFCRWRCCGKFFWGERHAL